MRIVFLHPPGRFPTVVHDLGLAWDALQAEGFEPLVVNANVNWWKTLCSETYVALLKGRFPLEEAINSKVSAGAGPRAMAKMAELAGRALGAMKGKNTYEAADRYAAAVKPFADYLRLLNYIQPEFRVGAGTGPAADGLDYSSSAALCDFSGRDTALSASVETALADFPAQADACFLYITSPQDLLTGLIAARRLRQSRPGLYLSILSHGYENFSLGRISDALAGNKAFFGLIDSMVRYGNQKDAAALFLARSLARGVRPAGVLEIAEPQALTTRGPTSQPLTEIFAPETVFWTRLSGKRCYWNRCNFCVQNNKHIDGAIPTVEEVDFALLRLAGLLERGCKHIYFCDEAVSPALLERLCAVIKAKEYRFSWACRCRIDAGFSGELFDRMKEAGCYEVLFGVESVVPRVQKLMNKYDRDMDETAIGGILKLAKTAGINIHLALLVGFPGETLQEMEATLKFTTTALKAVDLATFYVNTFALYPGSEVYAHCANYDISITPSKGDLFPACAYSYIDETRQRDYGKICRALPGLVERMNSELGWSNLPDKPEYHLCRDLYFNYGHGAYIKSAGVDIFKALRNALP